MNKTCFQCLKCIIHEVLFSLLHLYHDMSPEKLTRDHYQLNNLPSNYVHSNGMVMSWYRKVTEKMCFDEIGIKSCSVNRKNYYTRKKKTLYEMICLKKYYSYTINSTIVSSIVNQSSIVCGIVS